MADTTPPTIAITSSKIKLEAGETALITFTLSEPATYFVVSDIVFTGSGTLTGFSGSGSNYSAVFTPAPTGEGSSVVSVGDFKFSDALGNFNEDGADTDNAVTISISGSTPPIPLIQFATNSSSANEGNAGSTTVTVQATLSAASTQAVTVPISYSGTATSGTDYMNATTSISIPAGQTTGTATFSVAGDTTFEPDETVILTIGTPTNASLGTNSTYTHTVLNDDLDQQVVNRNNALTVLVDLGSTPVLLKDLVEEIKTTGTTVTSHIVSHQGTKFKYSDIDSLITTVIRNSEFTEEFRKEFVD